MFDPDHLDPAVIRHREDEARKALVEGVRVRIPGRVRRMQPSVGTLLANHIGRDFPYEVQFGNGSTDFFTWYELEVVPVSK